MVAFPEFCVIKLSQDILEVIKKSSIDSYPLEACGFILSKGNKSFAIAVENESPEPRTQFLINPDSYIKAMQQGNIIGVWHSHVDEPPTPSVADIAGCESSNLTWLIIAINKTEADDFEFSHIETIEPSGKKVELTGRPYVFGVFDCYSLVADYLAEKHQIYIKKDYPRIEDFWKKGMPLFSKHWQDENFCITNDDLKDGDILMFQTDSSGEVNHVGVYVGDGMFLHHAIGRLSSIDIYGGYWKNHTVLHLRHKTKC